MMTETVYQTTTSWKRIVIWALKSSSFNTDSDNNSNKNYEKTSLVAQMWSTNTVGAEYF